VPVRDSTYLYMRDGIFYIANGNAEKVMEFSSYGDILSLLYDPEITPQPFLLAGDGSGQMNVTKRAYRFDFVRPGPFAISPDKEILIVDEVPANRVEFDARLGIVLNHVILRFSQNGSLSDFLGQEGPGGTPLPFIERLAVTEKGSIVAFCRTPKAGIVFWYNPDGYLRYTVEFQYEKLPSTIADQGVVSLDAVFPDPDEETLFLKLDSYRYVGSGAVRGKTSVEFQKSMIVPFSLATQTYGRGFDIPRNIFTSESSDGIDSVQEEALFDFLGIASGNALFFLSPTGKNEYELLIMRGNGEVESRVTLVLEDGEIVYRNLFVSAQGILCGLIGYEDRVDVVWWRSDSIIERISR